MLLVPLSVDGKSEFSTIPPQYICLINRPVIFTVASLVITDSFPTSTQALAGAVFNTMAQFGTSIGIAIMAVISSSVSHEHSASNPTTNSALMQGYRAAFWGCFALMIMTVLVGIWGLRSVYRVGR
jgi:MFS family permease